MRKPVAMWSNEELVLEVGEGNPGAIRVASQLISTGNRASVEKMLALGIRGVRVWLVFKDLGDQTLAKLIENVETADIQARLAALGYACEPPAPGA